MSRHGSLLPITADSRLEAEIKVYIDLWPSWAAMGTMRSVWLRAVERVLEDFYPQSSSADRTLTARTLAPFALAQPGVR